MDASSGVNGRSMAMPNKGNRKPEYSAGIMPFGVSNLESDRSSHSPLRQGLKNPSAWARTSIWNDNNTRFGRDTGRSRGSFPAPTSLPPPQSQDSTDNNAFINSMNSNSVEKTGSASLVTPEPDRWSLGNGRSPWDSTAASKPHTRSSGVSPARKPSFQGLQGQPLGDASPSAYFPMSRLPGLSQPPGTKLTKPSLDPTINNFTSARQVDPLIQTSFNSFAFQPETSQQRPDASVGSWGDTASVHSPNDDRRSVAASDFYGTSSSTPSRNGSLPPSRHGEPAQLASQANEHYARYVQANPRGHSSFSHANGRIAKEQRSASIHSDSLHLLNRLHLEQDHEAPISHRASISINNSALNPSANDLPFSRDNYNESQGLGIRQDEGGFNNPTSYTHEGLSNGGISDPNLQFGTFRFDSRSAPNGTAARQSPYYSPHVQTPPAFDHLYPSRTDQTLSHGNNISIVQSKLQGYQQQQQERRNIVNPSQFHQQQFQHLLSTNQMRPPYGYAYAVPNNMPLNTMAPNLPMSMIPQMPLLPEAPRAQREPQPTGEALMSKTLWEYRQSSKNGSRKFELKDIFGHVVEFSGDQHGSRFIQGKLEVANSDEKERVFKELSDDSLQLMQDVFGNYVIQKFFEHGDQTQKRTLALRMKGHVYHLSMQMYGCRVVQKALEHVLTDQQAELVKELEKDVLACVKDQNGNHVVQKAIERVPFKHIQFIVETFRGQVGTLSVNGYGCRVVQRMLEFVPEPARRFILEELRVEASKLITDQYGNYVAQHVIQHGMKDDSEHFIALVTKDILLYSKHKFASNVVERCLVCGTDQQRRAIMLKVTALNERGESNLKMLVRDNYGNYVIQKILETLCREDYDEFVTKLQPEMEDAKKVISGKQVIQIEKKLHRFDRVDSVSHTPQRSSVSSAMDDVPALTSDSQSPQSNSPSGNTSTVEDPVHNTTPIANKALNQSGVVGIANAS